MHFINKSIVVIMIVGFAISTMGQGNQVSNSSFDIVDGKVKKAGQITLTGDWYSPSIEAADIYMRECKNPEFSVPKNQYGECESMQGDFYAGIRVFADKGRMPLTYLSTRLKKPMQEGKTYCIRFNVSLADMSKFASNNIGLYVSNKAITNKDIDKHEITPQIVHSTNRIFEEQFEWETICQIYQASGGEKYITIGNFAKPEDTEVKKMRRPRGMTGQQKSDAYYYIENVEVRNMAEVDDCDCEKVAGVNSMQIVYTRNVSEGIELEAVKLLELKKVSFDEGKADLDEKAKEKMNEVIEIMKENPSYIVEIQGHTNNVEELKTADNLSEARAKKVLAYFTANGIEASRLTIRAFRDSKPETDDQTTQGRAQNRRVGFKVTGGAEEEEEEEIEE